MIADILFEDERWERAGLAPLAESALSATLAHLGLDPGAVEISLLACDDARIAALNAEFRGKPTPTNVLSWPAEELAAAQDGGFPDVPDAGCDGMLAELGDIAIAFETCRREAAEQEKTFNDHVTHLVVHGCLHLLGYDHVRDRDADMMERMEIEILAKLGVSDPYG